LLLNPSLDVMSWRGMAHPNSHHPLYFFNACDVGQAQRILNFADGWAPAVLDGGASGFLGGLWSLADKGAADFAARFYQYLLETLSSDGSASVTGLLSRARREFYSTGDPTYLGYVFYGDVGLELVVR
jgi:CHAT domain-containing protein